MKRWENYIDLGTLSVMVITLILFLIALFTRGFTHTLLLEGGVFLISVKLMLNHYSQSLSIERLEQKLNENKQLLENILKQLKQ